MLRAYCVGVAAEAVNDIPPRRIAPHNEIKSSYFERSQVEFYPHINIQDFAFPRLLLNHFSTYLTLAT
jgi:hypothetical protein